MSDDYKTTITLRVDWADLDLFGHVNNVAFFKYIQAARVEYCDSVGLSSLNETDLSFMVASSQCQFKQPLKYPGLITVATKINWIKNSSFELSYLLINSSGEVCAEGRDVLVVFDHLNKKKKIISDELFETFISKEGRIIHREK